ncbi:Uncharacterised protein [Mycobacteroides abscessus subsp. abscessus]|nr:Uncharacterised protein [Mycobacteroides abscessus subsp. abscessus]
MFNDLTDHQKSLRQRLVGGSANDVDVQGHHLAARGCLDHGQTAPGKTRVDSHYSHAPALSL